MKLWGAKESCVHWTYAVAGVASPDKGPGVRKGAKGPPAL
jgi:hypothetical protein